MIKFEVTYKNESNDIVSKTFEEAYKLSIYLNRLKEKEYSIYLLFDDTKKLITLKELSLIDSLEAIKYHLNDGIKYVDYSMKNLEGLSFVIHMLKQLKNHIDWTLDDIKNVLGKKAWKEIN